MKQFFNVLQFELKSYISNKSYIISTVLIALAILVVMFVPGIKKQFDGSSSKSGASKKQEKQEDPTRYGIVDEKGYFKNDAILKQAYKDAKFTFYKDAKTLKKAVKKEKEDAGFVVESDLSYRYIVMNKEMFDEGQATFDEILTAVHKQNYCLENHLDYAQIQKGYEAKVNCKQEVLGKDAGNNYWYSYALVIAIFMVIVIYGVMIATAVTSEKSNRSIEVLVTSVNTNYLLFGKVLAGTIAAIFQVAIILAAALLGYSVNHDAWGNKLDILLQIPPQVLVAFALFGIGGFVFYSFLYGALGALVSKTEDINKSVGSLQMLIMIVYFVTLMQLGNVDGMPMKICSYIPFSSYSAMFVRVAMGKVASWEIVVSFVILVVSTFGAGWIAAKIYRMGTLRYGNPIKLSNALKSIRRESN